MKYHGPTLIENVYEAARRKDLKICDIEEKAGLSKGYLSRKRNQPDGAAPPLEALMSIAEQTDTSLYYLLNHNNPELSSTEDETVEFMNKLISETTSGKLSWSTELPSLFKKEDKNEFKAFHPLMEVGIGYSWEFLTNCYTSRFVSKFYDESYQLENESFNVELPNTDLRVYLMRVNYYIGRDELGFEEHETAIEMYFVSKNSVKPICCSHFVNENVSNKMIELYSVIKDTNSNIGLDSESKSAIRAFMNY